MKQKTLEYLEANQSSTPSKWREEAEFRRANAPWLRHSQRIAVKALLRMRDLHMTQTALAAKMGCTQQYVSLILKGNENLTLDILTKLEDTLGIKILD